MGKRIRAQRRGRGSSTWRAHTFRRVAPAKYPPISLGELKGALKADVVELVHDPGRGAPLAALRLETSEEFYTLAPEGVHEGQTIWVGSKAPVEVGNVLPLGDIPEGTVVCNIERSPGDGGELARSSGAYATIIAHTPEGTVVSLPSGKSLCLNDLCRATIGIVSGSGRTDKPFLKAGAKYHLMKAKGKKYPRTRGRAMVAAAHPYGSSKRSARKVTTVSRHAPPGQKVGLIAARRAGRRGKRKRERK